MCCWFESLSHHEIHCLYSRDWGNSSKRIFLKNIDFLVKMVFKDNSLETNLYEDAASKEIFTLYTREEFNLERITLKDFFKPVLNNVLDKKQVRKKSVLTRAGGLKQEGLVL